MSYVHPAWLEHQRQRFTKPDPIQRKTYAQRLIEQQHAAEEDERVAAERDALEQGLLSIRRQLAEVKFELAWRRIFHKYSPDQPRVPKGEPDGGQWTKEGSGDAGKEPTSTGSDGPILSDADPDPVLVGARYARGDR